jgi:hypothetical protein
VLPPITPRCHRQLPPPGCHCRAADAATALQPPPPCCSRCRRCHRRCPAAPLPAAAELPLPLPPPPRRCHGYPRAADTTAALLAVTAPLPRCLCRSTDAATALPPPIPRCRRCCNAACCSRAVAALLPTPTRCQHRRHRRRVSTPTAQLTESCRRRRAAASLTAMLPPSCHRCPPLPPPPLRCRHCRPDARRHRAAAALPHMASVTPVSGIRRKMLTNIFFFAESTVTRQLTMVNIIPPWIRKNVKSEDDKVLRSSQCCDLA